MLENLNRMRQRQADVGGRATRPAADSGAALPPPSPSPQPAAETQPDYRKLTNGETSIEGVLEQLDCGATSTVFHVRTAQGTSVFTARALSEVDFIAYREDFAQLPAAD